MSQILKQAFKQGAHVSQRLFFRHAYHTENIHHKITPILLQSFEQCASVEKLFSRDLTLSNTDAQQPWLELHKKLSIGSNVKNYELPTLSNNIYDKDIADPTVVQQQFHLPDIQNVIKEILTPAAQQSIEIITPSNDYFSPVVEKITLPYLVNIRRRKMKKHKLKKFRKRMIFVHRKLREVKRKRKEKALQAVERSFATKAQEFDAEKHIEAHLKEAKRGGWATDVIGKWKDSQVKSKELQ